MHTADPKQTQEATIQILLTLFPSWLPQFFSVMFAKPFPEFSNQMNAWVTALTCQWLMGPNEVVDYERPDGTIAKAQAVQVERCGPLSPGLPKCMLLAQRCAGSCNGARLIV